MWSSTDKNHSASDWQVPDGQLAHALLDHSAWQKEWRRRITNVEKYPLILFVVGLGQGSLFIDVSCSRSGLFFISVPKSSWPTLGSMLLDLWFVQYILRYPLAT